MTGEVRVAVIGAGPSGLAAVKSCLEEGLTPVCLEQRRNVGGLWNTTGCYDDVDVILPRPPPPPPSREWNAVYQSCAMITSADMTSYSDFLAGGVGGGATPFMSREAYSEYLEAYADHFRLRRHIRFRSRVVRVDVLEDAERVEGVRWRVSWVEEEKEEEEGKGTPAFPTHHPDHSLLGHESSHDDIFQGVMICSGHHWDPILPVYPGQTNFRGTILHARDYGSSPRRYAGKSVLVVGFGNTAVDLARDLAGYAKVVHLSRRRPGWVIPKVGPLGLPLDALANTRSIFALPRMLLDISIQALSKLYFRYALYDVIPENSALAAHPTIADALASCVISGLVRFKPDIRECHGDGISFVDDTREKIDVVIFATGYKTSFPFLPPGFLEEHTHSRDPDLYHDMFIPRRRYLSMAFVGLLQPVGAFGPLAEMQSRVYCRMMSGCIRLPADDVMEQDIRRKQRHHRASKVNTPRHRREVFWIPAMDGLADLIGCRPPIWRLMYRDLPLAVACLFAPCVPAQYRLIGPHAWAGARHVVMTTWKRLLSRNKL